MQLSLRGSHRLREDLKSESQERGIIMESNLFKRTVEFKGQDAVDAARIIERNMENKVFIHKLLISAMSLERVYVLKK